MKLIVGLGNPGDQYAKTRHNVGFRVCDAVQKHFDMSEWKYEKKFDAFISESTDKSLALLKPQTFMNKSGTSVSPFVRFFKVPAPNILIAYDDIDILFGEIKFKEKGSSAGHKGVQSIIDSLGTSDIARVKVGIGRTEKKIPTEDFVLQKFSSVEEKDLTTIVDSALGAVIRWIAG